MLLLKLFSGAGATGHVFFLKNGKLTDKGIAYSGLIGPMTTVAVVPTTPLILDFSVETRTADKQHITVVGNLKVSLTPEQVVSKFDFTVNPNGAYVNNWQEVLRALVTEKVLTPIREEALKHDIETAAKSHTSFETAITTGLDAAGKSVSDLGITVNSCSVAKVIINNAQVNDALGSKERESVLTVADTARHDRRMEGAKNDRAVKAYESETALKQEDERTKLIEKQGANEKTEATNEAAAAKERLAAFTGIDAKELLGIALVKLAEQGTSIGTLNIGPELLTALKHQ